MLLLVVKQDVNCEMMLRMVSITLTRLPMFLFAILEVSCVP